MPTSGRPDKPAPATGTLAVDRLRLLSLDPRNHPRQRPHLSAASGLVCANQLAYVIGDDEHHLAVYRDAASPGDLHRVVEGDLPRPKAARKRRKADFETLLRLPGDGSLVILGSGSRPNRERGVRIAIARDGLPQAPVPAFDLAAIYAPLRARIGEINIEGAFVQGRTLRLLNRGHVTGAGNVVADYRLRDVLELMAGRLQNIEPQALQRFELGAIDGVPLGFTDAAVLPSGGWVFSAVAEDSRDHYADGACRGSVIGIVGGDGRLLSVRRIGMPGKVEGIDVQLQCGGTVLFMVTDADDPARPSSLLSARL